MELFYYDDKIKKLEQELDYLPVITYLEKLYSMDCKTQYLITLIASAWYYLIEGDVNQIPKNYDSKYLKAKWNQYIDIGSKTSHKTQEYCYVAGYTLSLHWMYLGKEYEHKGNEFMQKCYDAISNKNLIALAQNFLDNSVPGSRYKKLRNARQICATLFPSDSKLDDYFRKILE